MSRLLRRLWKAGRHNEMIWRYGFNVRPSLNYLMRQHKLSDSERRVLAMLKRDGVATTAVGELLDENPFRELRSEIENLESQHTDRLDAGRSSAADPNFIGQKTFNFELLGRKPVFDPVSIYARFALQSPVVQVVHAYFGMYAKLRYYNVWHTFATQAEARESQLWHRDREDYHVLKMFVYLSDVDESAGPFTYALGTHPRGKFRRDAAYSMEGGVERSNDEQMAEVAPREQWVKCTGPKGTIIFADTRGYHKGGLARGRDRIMYTCMFTSPASQSERLLEVPNTINLPSDKEQRSALPIF